jgi:hypothetical protein
MALRIINGEHVRGDLWGVQVEIPGDSSLATWTCHVRPSRDSDTYEEATVGVVAAGGATTIDCRIESDDQDPDWWTVGATIVWDLELLDVGETSPQTIIGGKDRIIPDTTRVVTP